MYEFGIGILLKDTIVDTNLLRLSSKHLSAKEMREFDLEANRWMQWKHFQELKEYRES